MASCITISVIIAFVLAIVAWVGYSMFKDDDIGPGGMY